MVNSFQFDRWLSFGKGIKSIARLSQLHISRHSNVFYHFVCLIYGKSSINRSTVSQCVLVFWYFHRKKQIIAKNQNGNGLIFGIPQSERESCCMSMLISIPFFFSFTVWDSFLFAQWKCFAHFVLRPTKLNADERGNVKGLFLVIFLLELILQLNYLSQFRKMRTKARELEKNGRHWIVVHPMAYKHNKRKGFGFGLRWKRMGWKTWFWDGKRERKISSACFKRSKKEMRENRQR